jgi:hypothetical protein
MSKRTEATIEMILAFIGITHDNVRQDAYNHWKRFIEFIRNRTPANWKDDLRPKLRSYIGVDFRYIDDYYECCLSWGIIRSNNGLVDFVGIPDQKESFMDYVKKKQQKKKEDKPSA